MGSSLEQLKNYTVVVADTGDFEGNFSGQLLTFSFNRIHRTAVMDTVIKILSSIPTHLRLNPVSCTVVLILNPV